MKFPTNLAIAALVICAVFFSVDLVSAQDSEGPPRDRGLRGRPGWIGRGFPGGGMMGRMGGDPTIGLLRVEEVRSELEITPEQAEAIRKVTEANRPERPERMDFRSMSEEDRRNFFEEMREQQKASAAAIREQLEEVLLPQQFERLNQISIQQQGPQVLANSNVAEELGITEDQKKQLTEMRGEIQKMMQERMREMFSTGNREGMREKMTEIRQEIEEKVFGVLTSDQRTKLDEMKGEAFEMPKRQWGGRRDRGRRGGEGGRRGPRGDRDNDPDNQ